MKSGSPAPDDDAQSKRFIDAAKEHGADKSSAVFEKVVRAVIPTKPKDAVPAETPSKTHS